MSLFHKKDRASEERAEERAEGFIDAEDLTPDERDEPLPNPASEEREADEERGDALFDHGLINPSVGGEESLDALEDIERFNH